MAIVITNNPIDPLIATKTVEYLRPESVTNPDAERWEYFLVWEGTDGGIYCWLFKDFIKANEVNGEVINPKKNISKLLNNAPVFVEVVAEDLTLNEFDTLSDLLRVKEVRRYYKDGTYDRLAVVTSKNERRESGVRYNFALMLQEIEKPLLK